jgi:hypothetical protein
MLLVEFLHYRDSSGDVGIDHRYSPERDQSVVKRSDKRKLRLTLGQINQLRKQSEAHEFEKESEVEFIKQMYGPPPAEEQPPQ